MDTCAKLYQIDELRYKIARRQLISMRCLQPMSVRFTHKVHGNMHCLALKNILVLILFLPKVRDPFSRVY